MKYLDVKKGVKDKIKTMKHGDRLPSERGLAEIYNVDRITVRRALKDLVSEGFLTKKQGAGSFVNDKNVDESNKVSLLLPTFSTVEHDAIYKGIRKYIKDKDIAIELFDCGLNKNQEIQYLDYLERCKVNKIIIYPFFKDPITKAYTNTLNRIVDKGKKLVVLDQFILGVNADFVLFDKFKITYELFEYMIGKGHRNIVFFNSKYDTTNLVQKKAYDKILSDYPELEKNPSLYYELDVKRSTEPAKETMLEILKKNIYFSGVVCLHSSILNGINQAFVESEITDKEIAGVYHKGQSYEPKKPYVLENCEKLGFKAMEVLFADKNDEPGNANPKIHYIDSKFII